MAKRRHLPGAGPPGGLVLDFASRALRPRPRHAATPSAGLTSPAAFVPFRTVPRVLQRLLALALLALWLPATGHCAIGTLADWAHDACALACAHDAAAGTHADACDLIEDGDFKPASVAAQAPAPSLTLLSCLACLHARLLAEARPLAPPPWAKNHPADWVPQWAFDARAALPARAPDLS